MPRRAEQQHRHDNLGDPESDERALRRRNLRQGQPDQREHGRPEQRQFRGHLRHDAAAIGRGKTRRHAKYIRHAAPGNPLPVSAHRLHQQFRFLRLRRALESQRRLERHGPPNRRGRHVARRREHPPRRLTHHLCRRFQPDGRHLGNRLGAHDRARQRSGHRSEKRELGKCELELVNHLARFATRLPDEHRPHDGRPWLQPDQQQLVSFVRQ